MDLTVHQIRVLRHPCGPGMPRRTSLRSRSTVPGSSRAPGGGRRRPAWTDP